MAPPRDSARRALLGAVLLCLAAPAARAGFQSTDDFGSEDLPIPGKQLPPGWHGRAEMKREDTNRTDPEEQTKTYFRMDSYLWGGISSFQIAFPDDMSRGGRFNPTVGDLKLRHRFGYFPAGSWLMSFFLETTLPTAAIPELGGGKYQASGGWTSLRAGRPWHEAHLDTFTSQLQQVNSVAGDPDRTDINYTKLDLSLRDAWRRHWVKGAVNMRVDWIQNGRTGAVGELEYGYRPSRPWRVWLMGGGLLWGEGVKGTYGRRITLSASRTF